MPKPYEIVVPLINDEADFFKYLGSLVDVGFSPSGTTASLSGPRGNIDEVVM